MDKIDHRILMELQDNARLTLAELGRRVGLSSPAVSERVQRLEADDVITGYHATVDTAKLGRPLQAVLHMQVDRARFQKSVDQIQAMPGVLVCHRTTGSSSLVMIVAVASMEALEALIDRLLPFGEPITQLVLSTPLPRRSVAPSSS
ncbi:MAG: Lrp/AsnC family transcriptional regulator [Rubricoccaceae bacterium]